MNNMEFYKDPVYEYDELAICAEDSDTGIAKFYLPILTPFLNKDRPYDKQERIKSKLNIKSKNRDSLDISECNISNYIELHVPLKEAVKKDDKFIVTFIDGDINKPALLGRYYE